MSEQAPQELARKVLTPLEVDTPQTRSAKAIEAVKASKVLARTVQEQAKEIERLRAAFEWLETNRIHMQNYDTQGVCMWWNSTSDKPQMVYGKTILDAIQKAQDRQGQGKGKARANRRGV